MKFAVPTSIALAPFIDNKADHRRARKGKAHTKQHTADVEHENIGGKCIADCRASQRKEAKGDQLFRAKFGDQRAKKDIDDRGRNVTEAIVDGKERSLDAKCLGNRPQKQRLC